MHYPLRDGVPGPPTITTGDLRTGRRCEFGLLVEADVRLGRREAVAAAPDAVRERFGEAGRQWEQEVTERLTREHGGGGPGDGRGFAPGAGVRDARDLGPEETLALLADPTVRLVHQVPVRDDRLTGRADHLIRDEDGRWIVAETKLARSAHAHALVQVASYAQALAWQGVAVAPFVRLHLGDGSVVDTPREDVAEDLAATRSRVIEVLETHLAEGGPVAWGDPRWRACLRCDACRAELAVSGDVGIVAGVHSTRRRLLLEAGVCTVADLAAREEPVEGLEDHELAALRSQARLQLVPATPEQPLAHEVHSPAQLPDPSPGDVFFDFEGDPMWRESDPAGPATPLGEARDDAGLEYLFGCLTHEDGERFVPFWAHDRAQERAALVNFVEWIRQRRQRWPDMHVYHYAGYERTTLSRLAARHGVLEEEVAALIADDVLVDLYATVRASVRVGSPSYSIKALEPLYMGEDLRDPDGVTAGGESILEYQRYQDAVAAGQTEVAAECLEELRRYNEYDCLSTLRLRDWLLTHAR